MLLNRNRNMKKIIAAVIISTVIIGAYSFQVKKPAQSLLKASMERGKKVYDGTCITCHQADGLGVQRMNPPLVKTKWISGDKNALIKIILKGLKGGEIDIDGDTFHNPMPPQEALMSDQQIADVLTYVRNSFGNKYSAVTAASVKLVRAKLK